MTVDDTSYAPTYEWWLRLSDGLSLITDFLRTDLLSIAHFDTCSKGCLGYANIPLIL